MTQDFLKKKKKSDTKTLNTDLMATCDFSYTSYS